MEQHEYWNRNQMNKGKETRGNEKGNAEGRENMIDTKERKLKYKVERIRRWKGDSDKGQGERGREGGSRKRCRETKSVSARTIYAVKYSKEA